MGVFYGCVIDSLDFFIFYFWRQNSPLSFVLKYPFISSGHNVQDNLEKQQTLTKRNTWISNDKKKISTVVPNKDIMQLRSSTIKIKTNNFKKYLTNR